MNEENDITVDLINYLAKQKPGTNEYDKALEQLKNLTHIQKEMKELNPSKLGQFFSNPALVGIVGNFAIALLMLNYEKTDIITSSVRSMIRSK